MHRDAVGEGAVERGQRVVLAERDGPRSASAARRRRSTMRPLAHDHGLARQHAADAGEDGVAAGGELQLQQLVARLAHQLGRDEARRDEACGSEAKAKPCARLGVIERLDAERIARQHQPARGRIVQRDRVHAAQMAREVEPVAAIEMQRQLAIGLGREPRAAAALARSSM